MVSPLWNIRKNANAIRAVSTSIAGKLKCLVIDGNKGIVYYLTLCHRCLRSLEEIDEGSGIAYMSVRHIDSRQWWISHAIVVEHFLVLKASAIFVVIDVVRSYTRQGCRQRR